MALSKEDLDTIKLTIIETLNERLVKSEIKIAAVEKQAAEDMRAVEKKADRANTRIIILVSFLAGSGTLGAAGYGIIKAFGGG